MSDQTISPCGFEERVHIVRNEKPKTKFEEVHPIEIRIRRGGQGTMVVSLTEDEAQSLVGMLKAVIQKEST